MATHNPDLQITPDALAEFAEGAMRVRADRRLDLLVQSVAVGLPDLEIGLILPDEDLREFIDPPSEEEAQQITEEARLRTLNAVLSQVRVLRDESRTRDAYHAAAIRAQILRIIDRELKASLRLFNRDGTEANEPRRSEAKGAIPRAS